MLKNIRTALFWQLQMFFFSFFFGSVRKIVSEFFLYIFHSHFENKKKQRNRKKFSFSELKKEITFSIATEQRIKRWNRPWSHRHSSLSVNISFYQSILGFYDRRPHFCTPALIDPSPSFFDNEYWWWRSCFFRLLFM